MPVPPPRSGFVDDVLARAVASHERKAERPARPFARWETWFGVAIGAVVATAALLILRPQLPAAPEAGITLAVNESRNVDILIDSERTLDGATIRVVTTGSVELDGFDDKHAVEWQTRLERGRNVLSLPVVARGAGSAQLVAVIEHDGRTRRVAVTLIVKQPRRNEVA
jgi:hypothetical protein